MFNNKIESIKLTGEAIEKMPSMYNYTHFKFGHAGIVLLTNKNRGFRIPKLFLPYKDIEVLTFN